MADYWTSTTGLALIGFALFPLMPPRLLGNCREVGACIDSPYMTQWQNMVVCGALIQD